MKNLVLSGYALCWNEKAFIEEGDKRFYEQFQRGAFSETIKERNQKVLLFHKGIYEIESTLTLLEDEKGLAFRIDLSNTSEGRTIFNSVQDGTLKHASICFKNAKGVISEYRHFDHRIIEKAELTEMSLVDIPAYKTSIVRTGCDNSSLNLLAKINKTLKEFHK